MRTPPHSLAALARKGEGPAWATRWTRIRALSATTVVVVAAALPVPAPGQAAAGDLDTSFGSGGRQTTDFGGGQRADVALQADGKIVVAGEAGGDFALARFNADGSLDPAFAGDGRQTTDFGGAVDAANGVAVQSDGRILAVGGSGGAFAVARYNADGSLDAGFGVNGRQTTALGVGGSAWAVAIQTDGRIVAAGSSGPNFALARYNTDGSLDRTFSGDGVETTDVGGSDGARGLAIQADGKLVAAGRSGADFALARYQPDGSPDSTFSTDGKQSTDFGGDDYAMAVAIQPDGKIVAGGTAIRPDAGGYNPSGDFALARYTSDGSLDPSFAAGGTRTTELNWYEDGRDLAIQPDGAIVVAGGQTYPGYPENGGVFALARYTPDGSLDTTFAGTGAALTVFLGDVEFGAYARADSVAVQPDGKILAAGVVAASSVPGGFALARYQGGSDEPAAAPVNSTPPTISGSTTEGQTLTANPGAWSGSTPISHSYQWRRCDTAGANCADIAAATATTYALVAADVGHTIRVRETATNAFGQNSADSAPTAVVKAKAGAIAGTVRRARTGSPIAGASVNCGNDATATTASDGTYSIPNLAPGNYSCIASAPRHAPSTQTATIAPGQTTTVNFTLQRR